MANTETHHQIRPLAVALLTSFWLHDPMATRLATSPLLECLIRQSRPYVLCLNTTRGFPRNPRARGLNTVSDASEELRLAVNQRNFLPIWRSELVAMAGLEIHEECGSGAKILSGLAISSPSACSMLSFPSIESAGPSQSSLSIFDANLARIGTMHTLNSLFRRMQQNSIRIRKKYVIIAKPTPALL